MSETVQPLNVSTFIKSVRWSLLFAGIIYGSQKYVILKRYDAKQRIIRHRQYEEEKRKQAEETRKKDIHEITILAKEMDLTDLPPNWSDAI